jgi:hypothetical protein
MRAKKNGDTKLKQRREPWMGINQKGNMMNKNQRFSLDQDRKIIDGSNSANNGKCWCPAGMPEDDMHLREQLLFSRLQDLVGRLIINRNSLDVLPNAETFDPVFQERHSIIWALYNVIKTSHLNTFDVALSVQHKFDRQIHRKKQGMRDRTSLALFAEDVEHLLRDLYGDHDQQAIDRLREAVLAIVAEFAKHLRQDLWEEHQSAGDIDYMFADLPECGGLHASDIGRMHQAVHDLTERARSVRAEPAMFSKYTVSFVNDLYETWRPLSRSTEED